MSDAEKKGWTRERWSSSGSEKLTEEHRSVRRVFSSTVWPKEEGGSAAGYDGGKGNLSSSPEGEVVWKQRPHVGGVLTAHKKGEYTGRVRKEGGEDVE